MVVFYLVFAAPAKWRIDLRAEIGHYGILTDAFQNVFILSTFIEHIFLGITGAPQKVSFRLDAPFETARNDANFENRLRQDLARQLGIDPARIRGINITQGTLYRMFGLLF